MDAAYLYEDDSVDFESLFFFFLWLFLCETLVLSCLMPKIHFYFPSSSDVGM